VSAPFRTWTPLQTAAEVAPDTSRVWPMLRSATGSMARFELAPFAVSSRVVHRTVNELWYVVEGAGDLWRRAGALEASVRLEAGTCVDIPCDVAFQFRAGENGLAIIAVTMPPWPGDDEAVAVEGSTW
jgi:mannose-6-phosphate isomerase-like protein (cupin superfamily)